MNGGDLVRAHTRVAVLPLVPELRLHLITEECPLWRASEAEAAAAGLVEPYWAFCWPGGQALARYVLDRPALVRGKRVLDFGSGCGIEALAALRAGAASALAADLDPLAGAAARENAALNRLEGLATTSADLLDRPLEGFDVVLAGDVFYDRALALRVLGWLRAAARTGAVVLIGDPSRGFLDRRGLRVEATFVAAADGDTTGSQQRSADVLAVDPA